MQSQHPDVLVARDQIQNAAVNVQDENKDMD